MFVHMLEGLIIQICPTHQSREIFENSQRNEINCGGLMKKNILPIYFLLFLSESVMSGGNPFDFDDSSVPSGAPVSTSSTYYINGDDLPEIMSLAENGNIEAMTQLYRFYEMSEFNDEKALEWALKAAKSGDLESQYGVAVLYMNLKDFDSAKLWAIKAKEKGHAHASSLIQTIQDRQK